MHHHFDHFIGGIPHGGASRRLAMPLHTYRLQLPRLGCNPETSRRRQRLAPIVAAIALMTWMATSAGGSTTDEARRFTLNEALQIFRARSFDLILADAAVESARGDEAIAGAIANPSFSLSRGTSRGYDPSLCAGCSNQSIGIGVTDQAAISDTITGKRRLRLAVARAALNVSQQSRADVQRTLEFTLKEQQLQAELARQSLLHARESQRLTTATLDLVNKRYHAGAVSEADVARADVQKLEADQSAELAAQTLDSAKAGLAYLLGGFASADLDVADDLVRDAGTLNVAAASRELLIENTMKHRPDLQAAAAQIRRAEAGIDLARRLRLPDVLPTLQYSAEGHGQNAIQPATITVGISLTPPLLYRYRGELGKAEADLRTQSVARQKISAQIVLDVTTAFSAYASAKSRLERMQGVLIVRAARARDLVSLQYEKGAASLLELLDAQRTYVGAQAELLQTLNDYWTAVFQLEQATGLELRR